MKVNYKYPCDADPTATIEVGQASWDDDVSSIRLRFDKSGRFDPYSSSEIPPYCLPELIGHAVAHGLVRMEDVTEAMTTAMKDRLRSF